MLEVAVGVDAVVGEQALGGDHEGRLLAGDAREVDPVRVAAARHVEGAEILGEPGRQRLPAQRAGEGPPRSRGHLDLGRQVDLVVAWLRMESDQAVPLAVLREQDDRLVGVENRVAVRA
jgi:hypothetical protein